MSHITGRIIKFFAIGKPGIALGFTRKPQPQWLIRCPDCNGQGGQFEPPDYRNLDPDEWKDCARCDGLGLVPSDDGINP